MATFNFPAEAVAACNGGEAEQTAVINAITKLWNSYLKQDTAGYVASLTADVTRLSQRAGAIQQGREAVGAGLPAEWEAFEVSENMVVQRAELQFEQADAPTFVTVVYWVGTEGGKLWDYSDQGWFFRCGCGKMRLGWWRIMGIVGHWIMILKVMNQVNNLRLNLILLILLRI
jgi:hypothetical protein